MGEGICYACEETRSTSYTIDRLREYESKIGARGDGSRHNRLWSSALEVLKVRVCAALVFGNFDLPPLPQRVYHLRCWTGEPGT